MHGGILLAVFLTSTQIWSGYIFSTKILDKGTSDTSMFNYLCFFIFEYLIWLWNFFCLNMKTVFTSWTKIIPQYTLVVILIVIVYLIAN